MELFLQILTRIFEIENLVKGNKDRLIMTAVLGNYTQK